MRKNLTQLGFVLLWMAILVAAPGAKLSHRFTGWPDITPPTAAQENRELAKLPDFRSLPDRKWGAGLEDFYRDHVPARNWLVSQYKALHFRLLKSPLAQQVPGTGDWVFRRGGTWPEMDDFLGAATLSPGDLADWRTLLEGRAAWAEAHGTHYLLVLTPVKAQIHPEKVLPYLRIHRRPSVRSQLLKALADSPARSHLLCLSDSIDAAQHNGREVFYHDDHHVNAYGCYLLYAGIDSRLAELWFPGLPPPPPFYDNPPAEVIERRASGCYEADGRLEVSVPGSRRIALPPLKINLTNRHYPMIPICVEQPGEHRTIVFFHDSFLRYPLSSWGFHPPEHFAVPVGPGFDRVAMLIFKRVNTTYLNRAIAAGPPDVIVEQFPESKLLLGTVGLDDVMREAAAGAQDGDAH